ncbi:hypothetical protein EDD85DRAFT_795958 [Armillaria nabsnona]|nr:hypothetical protein EDD85DRAFT_795958 [Armillaria nabsnona]
MWPLWINKKENPARFEDGTDVDVCRDVHLSRRWLQQVVSYLLRAANIEMLLQSDSTWARNPVAGTVLFSQESEVWDTASTSSGPTHPLFICTWSSSIHNLPHGYKLMKFTLYGTFHVSHIFSIWMTMEHAHDEGPENLQPGDFHEHEA